MKQVDIMLDGEADAWYARNRERLGQSDPVSEVLVSARIHPQRVLEIGCANGWRLEALRSRYGCKVVGIEPSMKACMAARVPVSQATAEAVPFEKNAFDLVIYGFNLYLADPADWMRIAAEGDRVLQTDGHIVIHDFCEMVDEANRGCAVPPFARRYEHRDGILAYHFDFARLWIANPLYRIVRRQRYEDRDEMVTVMRKLSVEEAIEVKP